MTPQEKAIELYNKYLPYVNDYAYPEIATKELCMITIGEIIKSRKDDSRFGDTLLSTSSEYYNPHPMYITYWLQVKQEIEKL
jgi:hypothetical protein